MAILASMLKWLWRFPLVIIALMGFTMCAETIAPVNAQAKFDNFERDQSRTMLREIEKDIKKHYYDPKLHGIDLEAHFQEADLRIRTANSFTQTFGIIAGALEGFSDSHLFFIPPSSSLRVDYGYRLEMIGDACFVTSLRPDSDAAAKLTPGDKVLAWMGYPPTRDNFWKMRYLYTVLSPQSTTTLLVKSPVGQESEVQVTSKVRETKRVLDFTGMGTGADFWQLIRDAQTQGWLLRQRVHVAGDEAVVWKMPLFALPDAEVDQLIAIARKHKSLILDLRGNTGGSVATLLRLVADVIDHDIKIADRHGRKEMKPLFAKTAGGRAFSGKLVVLIDGQSASAAELFARVVQLEHRGTVVGDRSAGEVMEAKYYSYKLGTYTNFAYGASITDADLIMADGKSLEHTGVTRDKLVIPSSADLAAGLDPALSQAATLVGLQISSEDAGKMFPAEWSPF